MGKKQKVPELKKYQAKGDIKMNSYNDKDLFKRYLKLFGDEPPFPPEHIMKTLVKMKEDGTFEKKLDLIKGDKTKKIVNTIEKISGEKCLQNIHFLILILKRTLSYFSKVLNHQLVSMKISNLKINTYSLL